MSPHGSSPAKEPNELYDNLNQTGQDVWDLIGSYGFRPDKNDAGEWIALATQGDDVLGPCESLSALGTVVEAHAKAADKESVIEGQIDLREDAVEEPQKPKVHKLTKLPKGSTLQDVAVWSEIKHLGYSAEKDEDGLWTAYQIEGDDEIGAAETITELRDLITNQLIDHTEITIEVDPATEAPFLAGMAPTVNKQLATAIIAQHKAKMARVEATAEETKQNKHMAIVGTLHKSLYVADPGQPGSKIFNVGKITSRLIHTEEEKFVTEKASSGMGEE